MEQQLTTAARPAPRKHAPLSGREQQIAELLMSGYAVINIAAILELSEHTVRTYVRRLYRKLDITNRVDLVRTMLEERHGSLGLPSHH